MSPPPRILRIVTGALLLAAVACEPGDDGDPGAGPAWTTSTASSTTPSTPDSPEPGASGCVDTIEPAPVAAEDESVVVLSCRREDGFMVPSVSGREGEGLNDVRTRIEAVTEGLTSEESAGGYVVAWDRPIDAAVLVDGARVQIDLDPATRDVVIASNGNSNAFFAPLVGTAFLDPAVDEVTVTLGGDESEGAEWWEATDLSWTRDEWNRPFAG